MSPSAKKIQPRSRHRQSPRRSGALDRRSGLEARRGIGAHAHRARSGHNTKRTRPGAGCATRQHGTAYRRTDSAQSCGANPGRWSITGIVADQDRHRDGGHSRSADRTCSTAAGLSHYRRRFRARTTGAVPLTAPIFTLSCVGRHQTSPRPFAIATACDVLRAPSFESTFDRCISTVRMLMPSSKAMPLLCWPLTRYSRTSLSRTLR